MAFCRRLIPQMRMPDQKFDSTLEADAFWRSSRDRIVLDVRSPGEFEQGHVPGAINLPLFDDAERAEVGTIYKNSGRNDAVLRGLGLVGPKMAEIAKQARRLTLGNSVDVFLHCWRGGMRSHSMHWLLATVGLSPKILDGGYKAFRRMAQAQIQRQWPLKVISGLTGVGKTRVLKMLSSAGEAVIDLEGLANHRGSAFGAIGQNAQPTTEQFENNLFAELDRHRQADRIWVEDEGNRLGAVVVPPPFVRLLKASQGVFLESSKKHRIDILMQDYGEFSGERLKESVQAIRKRLGFDLATQTMNAIDAGQIQQAIEIVLEYYDRTYLHSAAKSPRPEMPKLNIDQLSDERIIQQLLALA